MTRVRLSWALCAVLLSLPQSGAANDGPLAQVLCAPAQDMRHRLETTYRAAPAWAGLRGPDEVLQLWQDAEGAWALIIAYAGGSWCIVAMGDVFHPFADLPHS